MKQITKFLIQAGVLLKIWFQEVLIWEGLSKDVNLLSQSCLSCQQSKVQTHILSILFNKSRRMCQGFTRFLDPNLWSSSSDHLRARSTIHNLKLHSDFSLQVPWKHTFSNYILPSSIQRPGRKVSPLSQGVSETLIIWNRLVPPSTSGFTWSLECSQRGFCSEALFCTQLVLPGEFLDSPELADSKINKLYIN